MGTTSKGWSLKSSWHLSLKIGEKAHLLRKQVGLNASSINESLLPAMQDFFYISPIQHYNHVGTGGAVVSTVCDYTIIDMLDDNYHAIGKVAARPLTNMETWSNSGNYEWGELVNSTNVGDARYFHDVLYSGCTTHNTILGFFDNKTGTPIIIGNANVEYRALCVCQDKLWAFGANSTDTRYTINGRDWLPGAALPISLNWCSAACNGSTMVVLGADEVLNLAVRSTDGGITWITATLTDQLWSMVECSATIFVAVSAMPRVNYATSTNGIVWSNRSFAVSISVLSFTNGRFYAVNAGSEVDYVLYSTNGTSWTTMTMPAATVWSAPVYVDGLYHIADVHGTKTYISTTGTSGWVLWRPGFNNASFTGFYAMVRSSSTGTKCAFYGQNSNTMVFYQTAKSFYLRGGFSVRIGVSALPCDSANGALVIAPTVVFQLSSTTTVVTYILFGNLSPRQLFSATGVIPSTNGRWVNLVNSTLFTMVNTSTGEVFTIDSEMKYGFTARTQLNLTGELFSAGLQFNNKFIIYGPGDLQDTNRTSYLYSNDGITWIKYTTLTSACWYSAAYDTTHGALLLVSKTGVTAVSSDGINWAFGTIPNEYGKTTLYQNGVFVSFHQYYAHTAVSTDGLNWSIHLDALPVGICACSAAGGGWFVVCGYNANQLSISTDGINWLQYSIADVISQVQYNQYTDTFLGINGNGSYLSDFNISGLYTCDGLGTAICFGYAEAYSCTLAYVAIDGVCPSVVSSNADVSISYHNYIGGTAGCVVSCAGYHVVGGTVFISGEGGAVVSSSSDFYAPQKVSYTALCSMVVSGYGFINTPKFIVGKAVIACESDIVITINYPGFSCTVNDTSYIVSGDSFNVEYLYAFGTSSIYALAGNSICKSINYGVTWELVNDGLTFSHYKLATNNTGSIIVSIRSDTSSIAKSSNSGTTFSELTTLTTISNVGSNGAGNDNFSAVHLSSTGQYQIVCTSSGFVYLSTDYGVSWTDKGQPDHVSIYSCMVLDSGIMLVASDARKILRSIDFGTTWDEVLSDYAFIKIAGTTDGRVLCVMSDTIHVSYNMGLTWQSISGLFDSSLQSLSFSSDGNFAVVSGYENSFVSSNSGASWTMVSSFMTPSVVSFNSGDFCFINVDATTSVLSGKQIKIVHNIGALVQPSSSVIIRIHHPRINNGFPTFQGTNAQVLGLMNYGIYYDESISSINGLLGSNEGSKSNTLGVLDFGVVNKINMDSLIEIGTIGDGLHFNTSAISGLMNDTTGSNSVLVAIDNNLNIINNSQVLDLANNEGKVSVSSVNDLTDATIISVAHTVQIILDGADITKYVTEATISSTESNIFDTINISIADGRNWNVDVALSEVKVVLNDATYTFLVEEFTGADNKRELWGRSLPAVYDEPWSSASVWSELNVSATTAHGLADEIIGTPVTWQVDDWPLPPKFEVSGTPIMAVQMIAQAAGGIVTASADSNSITVRRRWPVRSVNMTSANILLSRENAIEDVSVDKSEITAYGKVIVHGWEPEDTLPDFELEGEAILGQDAFIRLYWRGPDHPSFTKWITDGNATFVETVTEPLTEVVVFDDSSASVNKPIWSFTEFEWLGNDYGDISWLENGYSTNLESSDSPYGVAKVVYNTTYERWKLTNQAVETVQFGVEVTQGSVSAEVIFDSGGIAAGEEKVPLLGSVAACVQYGTAFLDETRISKTATTIIPRTTHLDTGTVVRVEDEVLGVSTFGKLKSVQTLITATRMTQNVQVDIC